MMMMRRNLGSVCAKCLQFGRGRRSYSSGTSGHNDDDWGTFGLACRILARGLAFAAGYKICGEILRPNNSQALRESVEEITSDLQALEEELKELGET